VQKTLTREQWEFNRLRTLTMPACDRQEQKTLYFRIRQFWRSFRQEFPMKKTLPIKIEGMLFIDWMRGHKISLEKEKKKR